VDVEKLPNSSSSRPKSPPSIPGIPVRGA
jgi:hypothetical protein